MHRQSGDCRCLCDVRKSMEEKDQKYLRRLEEKLEENYPQQKETLQSIVAIESVVSPQDGSAPFGKGVQKAFEYMLQKGKALGMDTYNGENYGGHIELKADEPGAETMAILVHLDTVPIGEGWTKDSLGKDMKDGVFYGRGVADDKGPAIEALYAMKAIADCGFTRHKNIRLILGLDEETQWMGMERYKELCDPPNFGFTPDADFPAIHGEKGIMIFDIAKKLSAGNGQGLVLKKMKGGSAPNMVAGSATAILGASDSQLYEEVQRQATQWKEEGRMDVAARRRGKSLEIKTTGVLAHGARPDLGKNAISQLMEFLGTLHLANEEAAEFIEFYNQYIGYEIHGESLGISQEDQLSGPTTVTVGLLEMNQEAVQITINCRYPVTGSSSVVYTGMQPILEKYNLGLVKNLNEKPLLVDKDSHLVETLMDAYRYHTGDADSQPIVIGGGTYARAFDNVVAFGALFPEEEDVMHQADEHIKESSFKKATKIYADAIYRLACSDASAENQEIDEGNQYEATTEKSGV